MPFTASVISAANWGAVPPKELPAETIPKLIIIHHTDSPNPPNALSKGTLEGGKQLARNIQRAHMDTNGWNDSGHNFLNTIGGFVLEGRQGTLAAIPKGHCVRSAHAGNKAANESPGIENEGNFMTHRMGTAQWNSLVELCAALCSAYNIDPDNIKGHRDFKATDCPGDWLYSQLPRLRRVVRQTLAPPSIPLKKGSKGSKVKDLQKYLKAWGFNPGSIDGVFGTNTQTSVIGFQKSKGLTADGVVEAKTWKALITSAPPQPLSSEIISMVDVCKYYQSLPAQDRALEWLQGQIPKPIMDEFARKWRDRTSPQPAQPLTMINVCKYYDGLSYQNEALEWLEGQISKAVLEQFAQKWRS
ncbi:N-acetylmuramoyl-L-alanine amidase [Aerosakkonema sp. BLCC-F183]|uniref:peptidoglycan recognition protein family protein n=1 Tax=Aerosakkonema sp. BLCC-F183 TaxID=3342834 RepID=UPI0035B763ED